MEESAFPQQQPIFMGGKLPLKPGLLLEATLWAFPHFFQTPPCARRGTFDILRTRSLETAGAIFEKRQLETKENYNSYDEIGRTRVRPISEKSLGQGGEEAGGSRRPAVLLSVYGRTTDALASGGDEGRGRLRQAPGSRQQALIRGFPNGATRPPSPAVIGG